MYDDLNKRNRKKLILVVILLILSIAMLPILFFNGFGLVDLIADRSFTPDKVRLYGGIFFVIVGLAGIVGLRQALRDTPIKSLKTYAKKTEHPEATLERLKETWESGVQLRAWCRMDEAYFITFLNGTNAIVVPIQDVVWAYQTTAKLNYVVKSNTMLSVHYANQNNQVISLSETVIHVILQQFMEKHRHIAVGHTRDVEKLYHQKDLAGLKEYALQQRIGVNA